MTRRLPGTQKVGRSSGEAGGIRWYTFRLPDKRRPVLILTRNDVLDRLNEIIVVPATRTIRGLTTEVVLTPEDGMRTACALNFDHVALAQRERHDLTESEEALLIEIRDRLEIPESAVAPELGVLQELRDLRSVRAGKLLRIEASVRLQKTEECYFEEKARLLKQATLRRFQRDGQRYAVRGFVVDKEGTVVITNKRILLVHSGTTSVRHDRILDVDVDCDRNLIEIVRDGARRPLYLTCPNAPLAAATIAAAAGL